MVRGAVGLGAIFDESKSVGSANFRNLVHGTGSPAHVDQQDGTRVRTNLLLQVRFSL